MIIFTLFKEVLFRLLQGKKRFGKSAGHRAGELTSNKPSIRKGVQPASSVAMETRKYLLRHYELRRNCRTGQVEIAAREEGNPWCIPTRFVPLTKAVKGSLYLDLQQAGTGLMYQSTLDVLVNNNAIPTYDPIQQYIRSLPAADGGMYIEEVCARVTDDEGERRWLKVWFLGLVAQATGRTSTFGNPLCPILISTRQGWGKSQFLKRLLPTELSTYYTDSFDLGREDSCERKMASCLLINVDEIDRYGAQRQALLKKFIQEPDMKVRERYRDNLLDLPRMASFAATTNNPYPLTDRSGSRRFICIRLTRPIDNTTPLPYAKMWAQATSELEAGTSPYFLDMDEVVKLEAHNAPFIIYNGLARLLREHCEFFAPAEGERATESNSYTAAEIYDWLAAISPEVTDCFPVRNFGVQLKAHGAIEARRGNNRVYYARLK